MLNVERSVLSTPGWPRIGITFIIAPRKTETGGAHERREETIRNPHLAQGAWTGCRRNRVFSPRVLSRQPGSAPRSRGGLRHLSGAARSSQNHAPMFLRRPGHRTVVHRPAAGMFLAHLWPRCRALVAGARVLDCGV